VVQEGRDYVVPRGIIQFVVHTHHDIERALFNWRRHEDLGYATREILFQHVQREELPGAFEDDCNSRPVPRHFVTGAEIGVLNRISIYCDTMFGAGDRHGPTAVDTVELEQMGDCLRAAIQFVNMDDRDLLITERGAQREATHASKSVNSYSC